MIGRKYWDRRMENLVSDVRLIAAFLGKLKVIA
jgi:hypothetical protein